MAGGRAAHAREVLANELFGRRHLDVADDDHGHAIGAVVVAIEVPQTLRRKALEDLRRANRQAVDVARGAEERLHLRLLHPRAGAQSSAPFLDHDAPFTIDLDGIERQAAGEVAERLEPALEHAGCSVGTSSM